MHENGKAKYRYLYAKTYTAVKKKLLNEQAQSKNYVSCKSNTSYDKWLNDWLISKKLIVKESTYIRYKNTVENHIRTELGKYPISKISSNLIENFIIKKSQNGKLSGGGLSNKSLSDIMVIIKETFKFAQSHGETVNCNFNRVSIRKTNNEMRVLSVAEEQKLVSIVSNNIDRYKLGILICLYTGIRIGELCALKCKNISITDKTLKIEATMQRLQCDDFNCLSKTKIIITDPKTYTSVRTIPLPEFLLEKIIPFIAVPDAYLLSGNSIDIVESRTMQNRFKAYLKQATVIDSCIQNRNRTEYQSCIKHNQSS